MAKSSKAKTAFRKPRTSIEITEANNSTSQRCVRCTLQHMMCIYDNDTQQCSGCKSAGKNCQLFVDSWLHASKTSLLGCRISCVCCNRKRCQCNYKTKDKFKFSIKCNECISRNKSASCWPGISFKGMRSTSPKLFSGVSNTFITQNGLKDIVTTVVYAAAEKFRATVDQPMNNDAEVSTKRNARARNQYGKVITDVTCQGKQYKHIWSYGSGSGNSSVGHSSK